MSIERVLDKMDDKAWAAIRNICTRGDDFTVHVGARARLCKTPFGPKLACMEEDDGSPITPASAFHMRADLPLGWMPELRVLAGTSECQDAFDVAVAVFSELGLVDGARSSPDGSMKVLDIPSAALLKAALTVRSKRLAMAMAGEARVQPSPPKASGNCARI